MAAPTRQARGFLLPFYALPQTRGYTGFLYTPPARGQLTYMKKMIADASQRELYIMQFAQFYVVSRTKMSYITKAMIASFHQKSNLYMRYIVSL